MPSRSAPTATTSTPYAGSALASRRACRLEPEPETSTTILVAARVVTAAPYPASDQRFHGPSSFYALCWDKTYICANQGEAVTSSDPAEPQPWEVDPPPATGEPP